MNKKNLIVRILKFISYAATAVAGFLSSNLF